MPLPDALFDLLRVSLALAAGYAVGSLPVTAWIARRAGAAPSDGRDGAPGAGDLWATAGPGPGLLALSGELARGIVPVAVATVTLGWWTGLVAAAGAVAGACWGLAGLRPGGGALPTLAGAALALAPLAGGVAIAAAVLAGFLGRMAGREPGRWAVLAGFTAYGCIAVLELADAARLLGVALLALPVALRRRAGPPGSPPDPA
jgi:glycerol-3-phosphate acyltransferase PlsY